LSLSGKRIVILAEDCYEDLELWYPKIRLEEEDAEIIVVVKDRQKASNKHGCDGRVDCDISTVNSDLFDGVSPWWRPGPRQVKTTQRDT
jgi:protease I